MDKHFRGFLADSDIQPCLIEPEYTAKELQLREAKVESYKRKRLAGNRPISHAVSGWKNQHESFHLLLPSEDVKDITLPLFWWQENWKTGMHVYIQLLVYHCVRTSSRTDPYLQSVTWFQTWKIKVLQFIERLAQVACCSTNVATPSPTWCWSHTIFKV